MKSAQFNGVSGNDGVKHGISKVTKSFIAFLVIGAVAISLTACGSVESEDDGMIVTSTSSSAFDESEQSEEVETSDATSERIVNSNFFDSYAGQYCMVAFAGAWHSYFDLESDGSFTGECTDDDYVESYFNDFNGKFAEPTQVDEYCWTTTVESFESDVMEGEVRYSNGRLYRGTTPYGFTSRGEFRIYLQGAPADSLPDIIVQYGYLDSENRLTRTCIYNVNDDSPFFLSTADDTHYTRITFDDPDTWTVKDGTYIGSLRSSYDSTAFDGETYNAFVLSSSVYDSDLDIMGILAYNDPSDTTDYINDNTTLATDSVTTLVFPTDENTQFMAVSGEASPNVFEDLDEFEAYVFQCEDSGLALILKVSNGVVTEATISS